MTDEAKKTPPPGSPEARELSCCCPSGENCGGRGYLGLPDSFVIVEGCPLHWTGDLGPPLTNRAITEGENE